MGQPKSANITWVDGKIQRADREKLLGQRGALLWFTGLSGSGKTAIALDLERRLLQRGKLCYRLDGDNIRFGLNRDLDFSPEGREENIRRIGEVAKLFVDAGVIVAACFISPYRNDRRRVRELFSNPEDFIEIYVQAPLEVCEQRDPKGLYRKARAGEIADFTGIHQPYEAPETPTLTLNTAEESVEQCSARIISHLEACGCLCGNGKPAEDK
ncbi:adenylyl-sulfate kinase [Candidatus Sumerlaeota bacterium]|nr:adenylyl-sulfate kinase [Candidatus Sumerlaeota bacterium]